VKIYSWCGGEILPLIAPRLSEDQLFGQSFFGFFNRKDSYPLSILLCVLCVKILLSTTNLSLRAISITGDFYCWRQNAAPTNLRAIANRPYYYYLTLRPLRNNFADFAVFSFYKSES